MSKAEQVSEQIKNMKLSDLLRMTAVAIDTGLDEKRLEFILIHLEIALQKRKMLISLGLKDERIRNANVYHD